MSTAPKVTHNILWTSGWDSTYRVIEVAISEDSVIRPWYVVDPDRRSRHIEIQTMDLIRSRLAEQYPHAAVKVLPTVYVNKQDIPTDPQISAAFNSLPGPDRWGPQYEWLARLAAHVGVAFEMGLTADGAIISRLGDFLNKDPKSGDYVFVFPPSHPAHQIFSSFRFPLAELSKPDMRDIATSLDFLDILEMTWFCQHPTLRGQACGLCVPCIQCREEGLGYRLPESSTFIGHMEFHVVNKSWGLFTRARSILRRLRAG